jgi:hypothetical protein
MSPPLQNGGDEIGSVHHRGLRARESLHLKKTLEKTKQHTPRKPCVLRTSQLSWFLQLCPFECESVCVCVCVCVCERERKREYVSMSKCVSECV